MIRRLRLENFRRHRELDLRFEPTDRLVVISGPNGSGKSSLLEAVGWALYGETREGRRHVDRVQRRGAEDEPTVVEVTLEVSGREIQVMRRRHSDVTSALVSVDGVTVASGAQAATDAVAGLLGLDSHGFALTAMARQGDLDGLVSLQPHRRLQTVGRLLRVDAVKDARDRARERVRLLRARWEGAGGGPDPAELEARVAELECRRREVADRLGSVDAEIGRLSSRLADAARDEAEWERWQRERSELAGRLRELEDRRDTLERTLARLADSRPVPPPRPDGDEADLVALRDALILARGRREAAAGLVAARDRLRDRLATLAVEDLDFDPAEVDRLCDEVDRLADTLDGLRSRRADLVARRADLVTARAPLRTALEGLEAVGGGVCDRCAQPVSATWAATRASQLRAELDDLDARIAGVEGDLAALEVSIGEVTGRLADTRAALEESRFALERYRNRTAEIARLEAELADLEDRLAALGDPDGDPGDIDRRLADVDARLETWRAWREAVEALERHEARVTATSMDLAEVTRAVEDTRAELASRAPDPGLEARVAGHREARVELDRLRERRAALRSDLAGLDGELRQVSRAAAEAREAEARRAGLAEQARVASMAADVLDRLHRTLSGRVRPLVEVSASEMLSAMSGGRFTQVVFDDGFAPRVFDDGAWRNLDELSGGESDLVALAVRLGLAEVAFGDGTGPGFLILDEVFGSQDPERRALILEALAAVRDRFGQVLLTSHVGRMEDVADRVVVVERAPGTVETVVEVI